MMWLLLVALLALPQEVLNQTVAGVGVIRGRVMDRDSGQPIPRAAIILISMVPGTQNRETVADDQGRFEFTKVPAGRFDLVATSGESRATHVRAFYRPPGDGRVPPLAAGETRTDVVIALVRSRAVSGRVVNEAGEPLARVRMQLRAVETGRSFAEGGFRTTDDRGRFRVFGLERGRYLVCAERAYPSAAVSADSYVTTCSPSELSQATAAEVTVSDSDVEGVEIRMRRSRVFSISGVVLDSSGQPLESGFASLDEYTADGSRGSALPLRAGGRFAVQGVPPGQYSVSAEVGGPDQPQHGRQRERGAVAVDVVDADVDGVVVRTRKAATLVGRVAFEGRAPPPKLGADVPFSIGIARDLALRRAGAQSGGTGLVRPDVTFELPDVFGRIKFRALNPPRGWMITSVRYRGDDIIDTPTEFPAGRQEIEVVMTDRGAIVTGTVTGDSGAPLAGARVLMFAVDPAKRTESFPFDLTARSNKEGRFTFDPRRAGEYFILAIAGTGPPFADEYPGALLDRLAPLAERITLIEADRRTVDLRVSALPEPRRTP